MDLTGTVRSEGGEEILSLEAMSDILEFLAVAGEEDGACEGTVAHPDNVALEILLSVGYRSEGLVVSTSSVGEISDGVFVKACCC